MSAYYGTFTMSGGTITGNTADYGGGAFIYSDNATHFIVSGSPMISENTNVDGDASFTNGLPQGEYRIKETSIGSENSAYENAYPGTGNRYRTFTVGPVPLVVYMANPEKIDLSIQTHHSSELYAMLNNHDIDLGFVYHQLHYTGILTDRLFEEKLYLVQTDTPSIGKKRIHTDELDSFRELFLSWDDKYQLWHDRWMAGSPRAHIQADAIGILELLWNRPDNWIIAPESVVAMLARRRPVYVSEIVNQPPNRVCYRIRHRFPKLTSQKAVEVFEEALGRYLESRNLQIPVGKVWRL